MAQVPRPGKTGDIPAVGPEGRPLTPPGPVPRANPPVARRSGVSTATGAALGSTGVKDSLIGRKLQEYVLESRLGVGGMGVVYKAVQPMIGKYVAIKVLRPDVVQDPRDMDRLLEEARVVSSIKNRGIINIFGAGALEDGRHYLIMELLEGESLEQLMARDGKVPAGDAVVILEQTLSALAAAHEAGVVHRDLKPGNVFLVKEANQSFVKLLDFGLARRQSQNVTRIAGTPDYISPEHARGRPAGPPADLYAFGVLCFHMLTGQLPFTGTTPMEVMEKHVHSPPPVPHEVNPAIPKALSELILKLLAKEPKDRPDAVQVKADLRAATKQLRNAMTMMSLSAIDPVTSKPPADEAKRAKVLARGAQVADLKRQVTRRWPILLGGVIGVWLLGVVIYVFWPSPPPPPVVTKHPTKEPVPVATKELVPEVKEPVREPTKAVDPPPVKPEETAVVDAGASEPIAAQPSGEVDAGDSAPSDENLDAVIDDVRMGELRRQNKIDEHLDEVDVAMKNDKKLKSLLREMATQARTTCEKAQTKRGFIECDDQVQDLYGTYQKNL
jgi:eukaryotic-like serine/threonine-protein kinase